MNLGTGTGYSIREVIRAVQEVTGRDVPHLVAPRRPGDPASLVSSPKLAEELLGWRPQHSSLENIVSTAWRWYSSKREVEK